MHPNRALALSLLLIGCELEDPKETDTGTAPVDADGDGFVAADDCDDENAAVNPDAAEVCDGVDNNCDDLVDDDDSAVDTSTGSTFYADGDGDGAGDEASTIDACSQPDGYAAAAGDCDDADSAVYSGATELCDGQYNDCDDPDYAAGATPAGEIDGDKDGYVACDYDSAVWVGDSAVIGGGDCDDADASLNPGMAEVCDTIDNDCDSLTDDADDSLDASTGSVFYADNDGDTFGDPKNTVGACLQPKGYVVDSTDCDDGNFDINPDAPENPQDGVDDNCDGYDGCSDLDCDGYTDVYYSSLASGSYHQVILGDGTSLTADSSLDACYTYDTEYGDFNGDGYVDLVHAPYGCGTGTNTLFYGSSAGFSSTAAESIVAPSALEVEVADLNSDGYDDIIYGNYYSSSGYIYWGSAAGVSSSVALPAENGWDLAVGDANGDGYTDVVFCGSSSYDSYLYYGSTSGFSTASYEALPGSYSYGCHMEDFDGDGYEDLLLGGYSYGYDNYTYWGSSSGYSTTDRTGVGNMDVYSYGISTGDFNADGYTDIVYANWGSADSIAYYGSKSGHSSKSTSTLATSYAFRAATADINGDGYDDVVIPSYNDGEAQVYLGSASGLATTADYALTAASPYNISAVDLDGDGYWELLVPGSNGLGLFWGSASGWSDADADTISVSTISPFAAPLVVTPDDSAKSL